MSKLTVKFGTGEPVEYSDGFNERHIANFKAERNSRLAETDQFSVSDRTLSEGMKTYRQALRELPENTVFTRDSDGNVIIDNNGSITGVTWPTKPS